MHCVFVTPPLDGPATGGTLYNRQLLAALGEFEQYSLAELPIQVRAEQVWVDSLYLAELPALRQRLDTKTRVGLLLHYLPSLLSNPQLRAANELSDVELRALEQADMVVTPSEFLRQLVLRLCPGKACACVSPGVEVPRLGGESVRDGSALMICNDREQGCAAVSAGARLVGLAECGLSHAHCRQLAAGSSVRAGVHRVVSAASVAA
jgi:hypothetical protein